MKVQLPLMRSYAEPQALVYTEDRELNVLTPVTPEIQRRMGKRKKAFFTAGIAGTTLHLHAEMPEQGW